MSLALKGVYPLPETTAYTPSLTVLGDLVFLAWAGEGNKHFSISISNDGGRSFRHKYTAREEQTDRSLAIASHDGKIYVAWKGVDARGLLNIAQLVLETDANGETFVTKLTGKRTHHSVSLSAGPALASHEGHLWVAYKRRDTSSFSISRFEPGLASISSRLSQNTAAADCQPSLVSHNGVLIAAWRGPGTNVVKVARMALDKSESNGLPSVNSLVVSNLNQSSWRTPMMASAPEAGLLYLGWGGASIDAWINLTASSDNGNHFISPNRVGYSTHAGVALAWFKDHLIVAWSAGKQINSHPILIARTRKIAPPTPPTTLGTMNPMSMYAGSETDMGSELSSGMQTPRTSICEDEWVMD